MTTEFTVLAVAGLLTLARSGACLAQMAVPSAPNGGTGARL
jgi:hypothetical protein